MSSDWKKVKLGDICSLIKRGITPKYTENDGVCIINQKCIRDQKLSYSSARKTDPNLKKISEEKLIRIGDALINSTGVGTLGRVAQVSYLPEPATTDSHVTIVRLQSEKINNIFFGLAIRYNEPIFQGMGEGSTGQTELSPKKIAQVSIKVPENINEQKAIADVLSSLDDKIELNRDMDKTLEGMAQALFKSWFVDFEPVKAKARLAGNYDGDDMSTERAEEFLSRLDPEIVKAFPDRFLDSELGKIPEGWEVGKLGDNLEIIETGKRPKGGVKNIKSGIPSIGAESIVGLGIFDYSKTKYIPIDYFDSMKRGIIQDRDVLLYKDGGRPGNFEPHLTMFGEGFPFLRCAINEHAYRLRARDDLGQNFLFFWLSSEIIMEEMRRKGTGVAIPGLNSTQVKSLTTLLPTKYILNVFNQITEALITSILINCINSTTLAKLRDSLLPKLMSGEIRVPFKKETPDSAKEAMRPPKRATVGA